MQAYQQSSTVQANKCLGFLQPPKMVLETDSIATACRKERAETLPSQGIYLAHETKADSNCFQQPGNNSKQQQVYPCQTFQQQVDQKMIPSQIHLNNQKYQQINPNFQQVSSPQSLVTRASESLEKILNQQRIYLEKQIQPKNNDNPQSAAILEKQQQQHLQRSFEQQQQQFKSGSQRPPQQGQYNEQTIDQSNKIDGSQDYNIQFKQHNYHGNQSESHQYQQKVEQSNNDQHQKFQKQQQPQLQQPQPIQYLSQVEQNYLQYQEERNRQKEQQYNEESQSVCEIDNQSNCESENQQVESFKIEIEKRFEQSEVNKIYEFPLDSSNGSINESDSSLISLCDARNYDLNIQNNAPSNRHQYQQNQQGQFIKKQQQPQHPTQEDYSQEKKTSPGQVCLSERPINQQEQSYLSKQPIPLNSKNNQNFSKNQSTNLKDNCAIINKADSSLEKHSNNNNLSGKTLQRTLQTKSIQNLHGLSNSPPQNKLLSTISETECVETNDAMSNNLNKSYNANGLGYSLQNKIKNQPYLQFSQQQQPSQIQPKDIQMFQGEDNQKISQGEGYSNSRLKQQLDTILKNNFIEPIDPSQNQMIQDKQQHDLNWRLLQEKSESCYRNVNNLIEKIQFEREKKQQQQQENDEVEGQGISEKEHLRRDFNSQEKDKVIIQEKQSQNPQQFQQSSSTSSVLQKMRAIISTEMKSPQIVHSPNTQSSRSQFQQLQASKKERYEISRSFEVRKHGNQHNNINNESNNNTNNSKSNQNISKNYLPSSSYSQTYLSKQLHATQVQQIVQQKTNIRPNNNQHKIQNIERTCSQKAFQDRSNIITSSKSQSRERTTTSGNQSASNNRTNPLISAVVTSEKSSVISNDLKRNHSNNTNDSHPPSRSASQKAAGAQEQLPSNSQSSLSSRLIKNQNSQSHKNITSPQIVHSKNQSNKHSTLMKKVPETDSFVSEKLPPQTVVASTDPPKQLLLPEHAQPTIFSPLPPSGKAEQSPGISSNSLESNSILTKNMLALSQRVQAAIQGQLSNSVSKEGNGLADSNKVKNTSGKKTSSSNLMKTQSNSNLITNTTTSTSSRVHMSSGGNHSFNNTSKTNIRDIRVKLSNDAMSPNNQTHNTNSFSQFKETPGMGEIKSNQSRRTDSSHGKTTQYQLQMDTTLPSNNNGNVISSPNQKNNNSHSYSQNKGNGYLSSQDPAKPASQSNKTLSSSSRERDNCGSSGRMQQHMLGYLSISDNSKNNQVNISQQPLQQDQQIPNSIKMKNNNMIILKNLLQQPQQQPGSVQSINNNKNNNESLIKKSQLQLNLDHSKLQNVPGNQSQIKTSQSNYANKTLIKVPSAATVGHALKRASPNKSTNQVYGPATHMNLHQAAQQDNNLNSRNHNNNSHSRAQHSQSPPHSFLNSTQTTRNQTNNQNNLSNNGNISNQQHTGEQKHHEISHPSQRSSQHASQPSTSASSKASLLHSIMQKTAKANKLLNQNYIDSQTDETNSSHALYKKSLEATLYNQISQQQDIQNQQQLKQHQQQLYSQNHHNIPRNNDSGNGNSVVTLNTQPSPVRNLGNQNSFNAVKKPQSNAPISYLLGSASSNISANSRNTAGNSKNLNNSCNTNQRNGGFISSKPINTTTIPISRNAQQNLSGTQNINSSSSILHSFIDQPSNDAKLSHNIPPTSNKEANREQNSGIQGIPRNDFQRGLPKNFSQKSVGGDKINNNNTNAYPQVQQLLQSMDFVSRKGNNEGPSSSSSQGILGQTSSFSSRYQPTGQYAQNNFNQDKLEQNNELQNRLKPQHMFEQHQINN